MVLITLSLTLTLLSVVVVSEPSDGEDIISSTRGGGFDVSADPSVVLHISQVKDCGLLTKVHLGHAITDEFSSAPLGESIVTLTKFVSKELMEPLTPLPALDELQPIKPVTLS